MPNPNSRDLSCSLASKTSAIERATAGTGEYGTRELATPLVSTSQPAGSLQQVVSPTLRHGQGYGATTEQPSPPPAQAAASATSGLWSNFWSELQGSQRLPSNAAPGNWCARGFHLFWPRPPFSSRKPRSGSDQGFGLSCGREWPNSRGISCSGRAASVCRGEPKALPTSGNAVLDAVLLEVQRLQTLQVQQLTSTKKVDASETVKTGIIAFPH